MSRFIEKSVSKYKLKIPEFICDKPLDDVMEPFPSQSSFFTVHIGPPRSGKSSLMISALSDKNIYKKKFNNVILVAPDRSMSSLKKNIFDDLAQEKIYNELTPETLIQVKSQLENYAANEENSILLLDDIGAYLRDGKIQQLLQEIVFNRRHMRVSIILLVQHFMSIPRPIRTMISNVFVWKQSNKKSLQSITEELMFFSPHESEELCNMCFQKPHDFLSLAVQDNKVYHNLNEVIDRNNV